MLIDRKSANIIRTRRAELRAEFDLAHSFAELEESCVPSYCHANALAAAVAWWRLLAACDLYRRFADPGPILDFGAATGELFHLLDTSQSYHYVEENDTLAAALQRRVPRAQRADLASLPREHFAAIFALDSLEHNVDVGGIVDALLSALRPGAHMVVSGPTENALYRLGRRIAGFDGHYHKVTIYDIERVLAKRLECVHVQRVPLALPLFRLSVWNRA
ncbi:MAG: hypothetical protein JSU66_07370 [Deltaproteobacteria bacterium]|nr:MAG: hypothetical protein JSU66_07370 [Deltaproteobacteria bacterium]